MEETSESSVMTNLAEYATKVEAKFPILGRLLWYSVSEPKIEYAQLETKMKSLGLSTDYLPPRTRGVDAFRLACKAAQKRRLHDGAIVENYLLREVVCDDDRVVEHIMQERVDAKGETLSYEKVGKAIYYRPDGANPGGRIAVVNEAPFYDDRMKGIVDDMLAIVQSDWRERVTFLHANAIRGVINRVLRDCATLRVRPSGGVFFSPEAYKDTVNKLAYLLNDLGGECHMHAVPLVDTEDEREMLTAAFENEAVKEIERSMDEMAAVLKSGKKITVNQASVFVEHHQRITAQTVEYAELLDEQLNRSTTSLEMFKKQVNLMVAKAE